MHWKLLGDFILFWVLALAYMFTMAALDYYFHLGKPDKFVAYIFASTATICVVIRERA